MVTENYRVNRMSYMKEPMIKKNRHSLNVNLKLCISGENKSA